MKTWKYALGALGTALLVAGCGGGGGETSTANTQGFNSLVSFGDSLSDVGTYNVGTVKALGGGKWTVNSPTAKNWTELIADQYKLPAPCPAQTGLPSVLFPGFTGAPVVPAATCRNYAQGSSRVTSPFGPSSLAIQNAVFATFGGTAGNPTSTVAAANAAGLGVMAVPVVTQMNTHLTNAGGSYSGKELVTVLAGGNDTFLNLNGVSSAAAGGPGAVGAAQFAGWTITPSLQGTLFGGGTTATNAAAQAAVQGMAQAGTELAGYIKTLVLAKGAKYVAVVNLPDVGLTPFALGFDPATKGLLGTMINAYNSALQSGLAGVSGVVLIDAYTQSRDQAANPAQYDLSNVTTPACSKTSPANPLKGSSLTCTASSLIAGDTSKYQYADDVHPTPYGYKLLAQLVTNKLIAAGWQ